MKTTFVLLLLGTTSHPPGIAQGLSNFSNSLYSGAGDFLILPALRSLAQASFANVLLSGLTRLTVKNITQKIKFPSLHSCFSSSTEVRTMNRICKCSFLRIKNYPNRHYVCKTQKLQSFCVMAFYFSLPSASFHLPYVTDTLSDACNLI